MRVAIGLLLALAVCACSAEAGEQPVEHVELRASGLDVSINHKGNGRFVSSQRFGHQQSGTFHVGPAGFDRMLNSLSAYQKQSGPTEETSRRFLASDCSGQLLLVTDAGTISVRWVGPSLDQTYIVDFGCDYQRHAERNQKLRNILKGLPVPEPASLP